MCQLACDNTLLRCCCWHALVDKDVIHSFAPFFDFFFGENAHRVLFQCCNSNPTVVLSNSGLHACCQCALSVPSCLFPALALALALALACRTDVDKLSDGFGTQGADVAGKVSFGECGCVRCVSGSGSHTHAHTQAHACMRLKPPTNVQGPVAALMYSAGAILIHTHTPAHGHPNTHTHTSTWAPNTHTHTSTWAPNTHTHTSTWAPNTHTQHQHMGT